MKTRKLVIAEALGFALLLAGPAWAQTEDIYVSASGSGTAGGVSFADEDIVLCDRSGGVGTCIWSMFFDGSAAGLGTPVDISAFHVLDDDNILMSFQTPKKIGDLNKVDDSDIVHYDRTAGPNGTFEFYFDGSEVGLTTDDETIDAIGFTPTGGGRLVISTDGDYSVPMTGGGTLSGGDEDLIVFNGTTGADGTSGDWELFFDGSEVGLNSPQEDIGGAWIDDFTDEIYLTTRGDFSLGSVTGGGTDIFVCDPLDFDPTTACATVSGFFFAADEDFEDKIIDGLFIVNNSPPIAVDDVFTTDEDTALTGNVLAANPTTPDSDPDGDPLILTEVNGSAADVGVTISLTSGALLQVDADGSMDYDPNGQFEWLGGGESTDDDFDYTIDDSNGGSDSATVTVTVTGVNDPPVLDPVGDKTVDEEVLLSFTATATDVENDTLTFSLSGAVPAGASITPGGDFTWTPSEAQGPGSYTFDVVVTDDGTPSLSDSETITVTVDEINVAPVLDLIGDQTVDEETLLSFTATATDADLPANTLTFSLAGAVPAGASITPGGAFTWTPTEAQGLGSYTFDVVVTDDGTPVLSDSETITVTVDEVNVAPVLDPIGDQTVDELSLLSFTATATDADLPANTLTFSLAGAVPAGASITPGGLFEWTPTEAQGPGSYTFDVVVTDDGTPNLSDSETITVTVNEINVAPVLGPIGNQTVDEETLLSFTATATDADLPPNILTFSLAGAVPTGASITPGGAFTWTPTEAQGPGSYTFDVVVTDDGVPILGDSETITVTVNDVNVAPVLDPIGDQMVDEKTLLSFTATASDPDIPPNTLTFSLAGAVPAGASITPGGLFEWTPTEAQGPGSYTFDVVVTDDGTPSLSDSETITVTVNDVNEPPVAVDQAYNATGNVTINVPAANGLLTGASDPDGDGMTVNGVSGVTAGAIVTTNADGSFSYTPPPGFNGSDTFSYTLIDDGVPAEVSNTATVTVTVSDMIWFVDAANAACAPACDGRINSPFNDLAVTASSFDVNAADTAGDTIYLADGAYTGGLSLLDGQLLVGDGSSSNLASITGITPATFSQPLPAFSGTDPVITSAGDGIGLGMGNTIRGLTVGDIANTAIHGTAVGVLTISESSIGDGSPSGGGIHVTTSGALDVTFDSLSTDSATEAGIFLNDVSGSFSVTDTSGTIQTGVVPAISIDGDASLAIDLTFATVSGRSIGLEDVTGGFTVTGTGSAGSGGTIQNWGIGIYLNNAENISLNQMQINDHGDFAIRGLDVDNFSLVDSTVDGVNGDSAAADEGSVRFTNLTGTALFSGSRIEGGFEDNIRIDNSVAAATASLNMTVQDSDSNPMIIGLNDNLAGNDGILLQTTGTAEATLTISGVEFSGARGDLVQANALDESDQVVIIENSTFENTHLNTVSGGGGITLSGGSAGSNITMGYTISGSTFTGAVGNAITANFSSAAGVVDGLIENNSIGSPGVPGSGSTTASGILVGAEKNGVAPGTIVHTVEISNNTILGVDGFAGIEVLSNRGTATDRAEVKATIENNVVEQMGTFAISGMYLLAGGSAASGDHAYLCADISRNIPIDASGATTGNNAIVFDQLSSDANHNLPGYGGSADGETLGGTASADIDSFLTGTKANTLVNGGAPAYPGGVNAGTVVGVTGNGSDCL